MSGRASAEVETLAILLPMFIVRFNSPVGQEYSFADEYVSSKLNSLEMYGRETDLAVSGVILHHSIRLFNKYIKSLNLGLDILRSS